MRSEARAGDLKKVHLVPRPFDSASWFLHRARTLGNALMMIRNELRSPVRLPLRRTLRCWRLGFGRVPYQLYSLAHRDPAGFVSRYTQSVWAHTVNGMSDFVINNKLVHHLLMQSTGLPHPEHLGFLDRRTVQGGAGQSPGEAAQQLYALLEWTPRIVVRPVKGNKGMGLLFLFRTPGGLFANHTPTTWENLETLVPQLAPAVVTAFVEPSHQSSALYPRTVNTVRYLTLWDPAEKQPFLAAAAQRIGTSRSFPADNFRGGLGGVTSRIEPETGRLGRVVGLDVQFRRFEQSDHPETGVRIEGIQLPGWKESVDRILEGARALYFAPMLAWDVVWTEDGFSVLEINGTPGLDVHQAHGPLLKDLRVRNFYRHHRLIR